MTTTPLTMSRLTRPLAFPRHRWQRCRHTKERMTKEQRRQERERQQQARIDARVQRVVAEAPPLTQEQRAKLAVLS